MTEGLEVVVLAAGQGSRMYSARPKVLHEIAGRSMLERVLDVVDELDPCRTHVVFGHGGAQVRDAIDRPELNWVCQAKQLGTGHAVAQAASHFGNGTVLVLYGDVPLITVATCERLLAGVTRDSVALLTALLKNTAGYGRVVRDEAGTIARIVEEKDATPEERAIKEINTGILATDAASLRRWVQALETNNAQGEYYLTDVIQLAVGDGKRVHVTQPNAMEEILGINDRQQLAYAERRFQRRQVRALMASGVTVSDPDRVDIRGDVSAARDVVIDVNVVFEGDVHLAEGVRVGPNNLIRNSVVGENSEILANCVLENARVGRNCRVGPFSRLRPGTELGESVHIGNFVEVKKSSIADRSKVNHLTYIGDTEIGRGVNIGAGTITCNYDGVNKHRTVIKDDVFVGSGVELVAPITVESGATIGAGSTIGRDVPADKLTLERSRERTISSWKRPSKASSSKTG